MNKELSLKLEQTSTQLSALSDRQLSHVGVLARAQVELEADIAETEKLLAAQKKKLEILSTVTLPEALADTGLAEIKLIDGTEVTLKPFYAAHISEAHAPKAHKWLVDNNFGSLIKRKLVLSFDADSEEEVVQAKRILLDSGLSFTEQESVNPQTLKSFVKNQLTAAAEDNAAKPPFDLFGIFLGKKAKVVLPKH